MQRILTLLTALPTSVAVLIILSATLIFKALLLWSVSYYNRLQLKRLRSLDSTADANYQASLRQYNEQHYSDQQHWPHTTPDWMTEPTPHVTTSTTSKLARPDIKSKPARHNTEDLQ